MRAMVLALAALAAGCFDFGKFQLPEGDGGAADSSTPADARSPGDARVADGANDQAVPGDLAAADLATADLADDAGVVCSLFQGNLLTATDSALDSQGDWMPFGGQLTILNPGCDGKAVQVCKSAPDGGVASITLAGQVTGGANLTAMVWVKVAGAGDAYLMLLANNREGSTDSQTTPASMMGGDWQRVTASAMVAAPDGGVVSYSMEVFLTAGSADDCFAIDQAWLTAN